MFILAIDHAHKTYVYTLFKTFSNQPLWELHENVNKITRKINALSKTRCFWKRLFENPVPINMRLQIRPRSVTVH